MTDYLKKLIHSFKTQGSVKTAQLIFSKVAFEGKIKKTATVLALRKSLSKNELVVNHGKHKFIFYGGGDRGEILYHAFWDKMISDEIEKIQNYVKQGDIVIDVGGNIGFFVLILDELVGKEGKIFSFEPSKRLKDRLEKTIKINNIQNVTIVNLALGESEGSTTLHYNPKQTGLSSIVTDFDKSSISEEIQITTLDKFLENITGRISFLKIDTEGYEPQVLKGAMEFIKRDKPTIYIELGGNYQNSSAEALKILKELNYSCEAENLDLKTIPAGINFIATPKS
jgi:FkbM family methyltransferase